jgi:hypothetical protein
MGLLHNAAVKQTYALQVDQTLREDRPGLLSEAAFAKEFIFLNAVTIRTHFPNNFFAVLQLSLFSIFSYWKCNSVGYIVHRQYKYHTIVINSVDNKDNRRYKFHLITTINVSTKNALHIYINSVDNEDNHKFKFVTPHIHELIRYRS